MSGWLGLIMVKGNHLSKADSILNVFEIGSDERTHFDTYFQTLEFLSGNDDRKAFTFCKGWTVIIDQERQMIFDTDQLKEISNMLKSPLFALSYYGTAGWYQFGYITNGGLLKKGTVREYLYNDGQITESGTSLEAESAFNEEGVNEFSLFELMKRITGLNEEDLINHQGFDVL